MQVKLQQSLSGACWSPYFPGKIIKLWFLYCACYPSLNLHGQKDAWGEFYMFASCERILTVSLIMWIRGTFWCKRYLCRSCARVAFMPRSVQDGYEILQPTLRMIPNECLNITPQNMFILEQVVTSRLHEACVCVDWFKLKFWTFLCVLSSQ